MIHQSNNFSKPNNDHREHQIMNNKKKKKKKSLTEVALSHKVCLMQVKSYLVCGL